MKLYLAVYKESNLPVFINDTLRGLKGDSLLACEHGLAVFTEKELGERWIQTYFRDGQVKLRPAELNLT